MASKSKNANNPFKVLDELYERASGILVKSAQPAEVLIESGAIHRVPDRIVADQLLSVLSKDIAFYSGELRKLRARHEKFPSKPKSKDDPRIFEAWTIGNEYISLIERMNSIFLPIAKEIMTLIELAATSKGEVNE